MADGEDRLVGLVEMSDDRLHALVDADVFRAAAAGDIDRVVAGRERVTIACVRDRAGRLQLRHALR